MFLLYLVLTKNSQDFIFNTCHKLLPLSKILIMTWVEILALITSGLLVGFINTLAGGGTIISLTILMLFGLSPSVANGTNRIAVLIQNIVAVRNFGKKKLIDTKKGIYYGIPTLIGSIIGAAIVIKINEKVIEYCFGGIMIIMLFFLIKSPESWLKSNEKLLQKPVSIKMVIIFFFIGIYGGFIHVGVGYFILMGLVLGLGYDLVKGNAMKNFLVLIYIPFTLLIFVINGQVRWDYGLTHSIGNIIGAYIASKWAIEWGVNFVRWVMIVIIFLSSLQMFGFIDLKQFISHLIH